MKDYPFIHASASHKLIARSFAAAQAASMKHHGKNFDEWCIVQGMLGEVILADMLDCLPSWRQHKNATLTLDASWDGGYDLVFNNKKIDCKAIAFRSATAVENLHIYRGLYGGSDVYVLMLIDENEIKREQGLHSIDWVDKVWCAGFVESNMFVERHNDRLRFPVHDLRSIVMVR